MPRSSFPWALTSHTSMRSRSAPIASSRGLKVVSALSSKAKIRTRPGARGGHISGGQLNPCPVLILLAMKAASIDFPEPGKPTMVEIMPRGIRSPISHSVSFSSISLTLLVFNAHGSCSSFLAKSRARCRRSSSSCGGLHFSLLISRNAARIAASLIPHPARRPASLARKSCLCPSLILPSVVPEALLGAFEPFDMASTSVEGSCGS